MMKKSEIHISKPYIGTKELEAIKRPLLSGWITQGPYVAEFERKFADLHHAKFAIATTSCTTALHLSLVALGIKEGDEVIVPAFTWIATANAVEYTGAKPVLCDIDKDTFNIDVSKIPDLVTSKTKAIIPVHLFGLCADMAPVKTICERKRIYIVEDAACAVGAEYKNKMAGSLGNIGCFSFHPRKIITTGEGGMCITNDHKFANRLISLRNHGASTSEEQRHHGAKPYLLPAFDVLGFNYRMTDIQGAIGLAQLDRLKFLIRQRRQWAEWYRKQLANIRWLRFPEIPRGYGHSYQAFVGYVDEQKAPMNRNSIMEHLHKKGIAARPGTHAVHMQGYYVKKYGYHPQDFPVARNCHNFTMAIPLHNCMQKANYEYVAETLKRLG